MLTLLLNLAAQIPNPPPEPPPGVDQLLNIVSYVKWGAGAAIITAFFGGLIVFTAGRLIDNHRFGNVGAIMMVVSLGGALLYGIGYLMISAFASGGGG